MSKAFNTFVAICLFLVAGGISLHVLDLDKPADELIDLSSFGGRILSNEQVKPGTFTVTSDFREAVKWGSDAILRYGSNGVDIWRPDAATNGVFQHSFHGFQGDGPYQYVAIIDGKNITLQTKLGLGALWMTLLWALGVSLIYKLIADVYVDVKSPIVAKHSF